MIHFVIGTRAQLFKMAPIMLECKRRDMKWRWVYTAQHKETIDKTLATFKLPKPDYQVLHWKTEANTMAKIWYWFVRMLLALFNGRRILARHTGKQHIVLTHGDTLTTWWGALLGKLNGCKVMHVEAGLRSYNILRPFPEEINRLITFRLADYFACPGDWAVSNLKKYKGVKINTHQNTQIDTIRFGLSICEKANFEVPTRPYVVTSIHRYENIFKRKTFEHIISLIDMVAKEYLILFIQHPATEIQLDKLGLRRQLTKNPNIRLLPRLEYLPFIKAIKHSRFVMTDGGGNQEELFHIGKPTLIFRNETERQEGLGKTTVLSKLDKKVVKDFMKNYQKYKNDSKISTVSPSKIIADHLKDFDG